MTFLSIKLRLVDHCLTLTVGQSYMALHCWPHFTHNGNKHICFQARLSKGRPLHLVPVPGFMSCVPWINPAQRSSMAWPLVLVHLFLTTCRRRAFLSHGNHRPPLGKAYSSDQPKGKEKGGSTTFPGCRLPFWSWLWWMSQNVLVGKWRWSALWCMTGGPFPLCCVFREF